MLDEKEQTQPDKLEEAINSEFGLDEQGSSNESDEDKTPDDEENHEEIHDDEDKTKPEETHEEYTKERFDGLMSTFNKKFDDLSKENEALRAQLLDKEKSSEPNDESTEDYVDDEKSQAMELIREAMKNDPVYQRMSKEYQEEQSLLNIVTESERLFNQMAIEDTSQDFTKDETKEHYYKLATELTNEFKMPFTVYSAYKYEQRNKSKVSEVKKDLEKEEERKKIAGLKPDGNSKLKTDNVESDTNENESFWNSVKKEFKK